MDSGLPRVTARWRLETRKVNEQQHPHHRQHDICIAASMAPLSLPSLYFGFDSARKSVNEWVSLQKKGAQKVLSLSSGRCSFFLDLFCRLCSLVAHLHSTGFTSCSLTIWVPMCRQPTGPFGGHTICVRHELTSQLVRDFSLIVSPNSMPRTLKIIIIIDHFVGGSNRKRLTAVAKVARRTFNYPSLHTHIHWSDWKEMSERFRTIRLEASGEFKNWQAVVWMTGNQFWCGLCLAWWPQRDFALRFIDELPGSRLTSGVSSAARI